METAILEKAYEQYVTKNKRYIESHGLQDAVQDAFLYFIERNAKGKLDSINQSFISRGVKYAKLNELKNPNANVLSFDDVVNTEDDIRIEDLISELDMKLQNVDVEIEIEKRVEEMVKHDKRIADIISFHKEGWNGKQLSEMFGISETVISRILNFQIKQDRKEKRKPIDKSKLKEFQTVAKKYGKIKKTYIRIGDIALMNDGRIYTKKNYFNGIRSGNEFLSYIDVITLEQFEEIASKIRKNDKNTVKRNLRFKQG